MKNTSYIGILFFLIASSCTSNENTTREKSPNDTPLALSDDESYSSSSNGYSSYGLSTINALYQEAIKNDTALKQLDNHYSEVRKMLRDSTASLNKYTNTIRDYWRDVNNSIAELNDTTRAKYIKENYKAIQDNWTKEIAPQVELLSQLDSLNKLLEDEMTLLKIAITQPMMYNYHNNELPDFDSYQPVQKSLNSQIIKTRKVLKNCDLSIYE